MRVSEDSGWGGGGREIPQETGTRGEDRSQFRTRRHREENGTRRIFYTNLCARRRQITEKREKEYSRHEGETNNS
jgi:hypothetical protein